MAVFVYGFRKISVHDADLSFLTVASMTQRKSQTPDINLCRAELMRAPATEKTP